MSELFKKALKLIIGTSPSDTSVPKKRTLEFISERELLSLESEIGGKLFGPVHPQGRREFFCLDTKTWLWHEQWIDPTTGKKREATTRYEVHEKGILKAQEGARYSFIEGDELDNFALATKLYYEQVARGVYQRDPYSGLPLA